jgi:hypothetical protein
MAATLTIAALMFAAGCGGGGRSAERSSQTGGNTGIPITAPPWYPPTLDQRVRTTAVFDHVTYYLPALESWYLYDATAGYTWISAIGSTPGLSASMTNPFSKVGIMVIPTKTYQNPGTVEFYIDGQPVKTLDLSSPTPFPGYKDNFVSYFEISSGLPETPHTVTMVITSGTVAFDGWRMEYRNQIYHIDCGDANTLDSDTIEAATKIRDGLEAYAGQAGAFPNPADFSELFSYMDNYYDIFDQYPKNPFTKDPMRNSTVYSAGDYDYVYGSETKYTLSAYGGTGTLITFTEDSVKTKILEMSLSAPMNHFATTTATIIFEGETAYNGSGDWGGPNLSICCGMNGQVSFPATGSFSIPIRLKEGENNIRVTLSDPFGQRVSLLRVISLDTTAPDIILIDPFPPVGEVGAQIINVYDSSTIVRAYVEPFSAATLNDIPMIVDSTGVFEIEMALDPGANVITIVASDNFNNTNTKSWTIMSHQ